MYFHTKMLLQWSGSADRCWYQKALQAPPTVKSRNYAFRLLFRIRPDSCALEAVIANNAKLQSIRDPETYLQQIYDPTEFLRF